MVTKGWSRSCFSLIKQFQNTFLVANGEEVLERAIIKNPGMALAVSGMIGVILACLIKRR
jgi:hypothetical protein